MDASWHTATSAVSRSRVIPGSHVSCKVADGPSTHATTVVIRNMPQELNRDDFLDMLDKEGFLSLCDFVYLPINFGLGRSFGYAFVNLVSPASARLFLEVFAGYCTWAVPWEAEAEVGWATLQGLHNHIEKYRNSPVMHETMQDEVKPLILKDGRRAPFPPPTKKISLVKRLRVRRSPEQQEAFNQEQERLPLPRAPQQLQPPRGPRGPSAQTCDRGRPSARCPEPMYVRTNMAAQYYNERLDTTPEPDSSKSSKSTSAGSWSHDTAPSFVQHPSLLQADMLQTAPPGLGIERPWAHAPQHEAGRRGAQCSVDGLVLAVANKLSLRANVVSL